MTTPRILRTAAFRLAMAYAAAYAFVLGVGLATVYWSLSRFVDSQVAASLRSAAAELERLQAREGREALRRRVGRLTAERPLTRAVLVDREGRVLAGSLAGWPPEAVPDGRVRLVPVPARLIGPQYADEQALWPAVAVSLPGGERLLLARVVREAEDLEEFALGVTVAVFVAGLVLALGFGLLLGGAVLRRIDAISAAVDEITAGDLSQRIPLGGRGDELDGLAARLNGMLDRIERLMGGMREVADNIAHDLRSPLTRLRGRLELALAHGDGDTVLEEAIGEIDAIVGTFEALLRIAEAEAGTRRGPWAPVDLGTVVAEVAELYEPLAEERGLAFARHPAAVAVTGNARLLAQAIANLVDNAIKYTPAGGRVTLAVAARDGEAVVTVADTGPGIPPAARERVLERFVRLDAARGTPGSGLGLSLVRAIVGLHGGRLSLEDNGPGLRAVLRLPRRR